MILPQVLWGVLLPAGVAGVVLFFLGGRSPAAAAALAVAAGYAAGCFALWGMPPFPPIDSGDWIFWLAIAAAGVAPLPLPPRARRLAGAAIACGLSSLVLLPVVRRNWSAPLGVAAVAGWSAAVLAFWWPLERLSIGAGARFAPVVLWVTAAGMSIALVAARSARLGQQAGMVAAALGAAAVLSWLPERVHLGRGSLGPYAVILTGLLMVGVHFAQLHWAAAILMLAAPAAAFGARSLAERCCPGAAAALAGLALGALLLAGAVGIQLAASPSSPYEGY